MPLKEPLHKSFLQMDIHQRADFFAQCQAILLRKQPDSEYVATQERIKFYTDVFKKFHDSYKGFCYQSENTCLLYNHVKLPPHADYKELARSLTYKFPAEDYNAVSIDFLTSADVRECVQLYTRIRTPSMKHIIYLRDGGVKVFPLSESVASMRTLASMFKL